MCSLPVFCVVAEPMLEVGSCKNLAHAPPVTGPSRAQTQTHKSSPVRRAIHNSFHTIMITPSTSCRSLLRTFSRNRCTISTSSSAPRLPNEHHGHLPNSQSLITSKLHFFNSVMGEGKQIPSFRILGHDGKPVEGAEVPEV